MLLILGIIIASGILFAQNRGRSPLATRQTRRAAKHEFIGLIDKLPSWVTRRSQPKTVNTKGITRAPGDQGVVRQNLLLTRKDPTALYFPIVAAPSQDLHPIWTADEKYIYFESNRNTATDTTAGANFGIYRMFVDGSGVSLVTGAAGVNRTWPAVTFDGNRIAYVEGVGATGQLFVQDLNAGTAPISLTAVNPSNFNFSDVQHPTWSNAGNVLAFAGKLAGDTNYHIFAVNTDSGQITQLTKISNDTAPAWSPDGNLIAFTTNASGFINAVNPNGVGVATASGTKANLDIWVLNPMNANSDAKQVTAKSFGGTATSNKNAAWAADTVGDTFLAFASNRADSTGNNIADSVGAHTDIYFMRATVVTDVAGAFTVSTTEGAGTIPSKLRTSTPDVAIVAPPFDAADPSFNFDPKNAASDEDYPAWPYRISEEIFTIRIAFQSNRPIGSDTSVNLFAATIEDVNAPSVLKYDAGNNEIVHVARANDPNTGLRQLTAGEKVIFRVRASDYESGVKSVFLQINDPNSQEQSADGIEHKIYSTSNDGFFGVNTAMGVPHEFDCQAINPNNNLNVFKGPGAANNFLAGQDDLGAFAGPPDPFWLPLTLHVDPVTKDAYYTNEVTTENPAGNVWTTPAALPSDWYINVIAIDNVNNWKIYDSIWGFTTQPWAQKSALLYVNDYDIGQKFFTSVFGLFAGRNNDFASVPTESWMTEFDPALEPTVYRDTSTPAKFIPIDGDLFPLGIHSYRGNPPFGPDTIYATNQPFLQAYDQWRILCRGPVPDSVLNAYGAKIVTQPPDILANPPGSTPRQQTVADRCVIWHAPYLGDLFVGPGTLLDTDTQTRLSAFVARGGRLFVDGQDAAWGIALGQPGVANAFLNNTMKVGFAGDGPEVFIDPDHVITLGAGRRTNPIGTEYFSPAPALEHFYQPIKTSGLDSPPSDTAIWSGEYDPTQKEQRAWSAGDASSEDVLSAQTGATIEGTNPAGPVLIWAAQTDHTKPVWKVGFSSIGFENIVTTAQPLPAPATTLIIRPIRAYMMHNIVCFMRTGRIVGQVKDVNGATALGGVFVRALNDAGVTMATAKTLGDGSYVLDGLDANGFYAIDAKLPGYITLHVEAVPFHGGDSSRLDLFLKQAQPGTISGKVTLADGTTPVAGITVQAKDNQNSAVFTAVTDTGGAYIITNVPASIYTVSVINLPATYSGTSPVNYNPVTVTPATDSPNNNFKLQLAPGALTGKVTKGDGNGGDTGTPIAGATVTAVIGTGTPVTAVTDSTGNYSFASLAASPPAWSVFAGAPGYATTSTVAVSVPSGGSVAQNFVLQPVPPGSVSGLVTRASDGTALSGVTITLEDSNGNPLKDTLGNTLTATTGATQTDNANYSFNYKITNVPAGQAITIVASLSGYTPSPTTLTPTIVSGTETQHQDFSMSPLHTFSSQISLVSAPFEYATSVADLLGIPAADRTNGKFQFYAWDGTKYVAYPNGGADTFHLGHGYFIGYTTNLSLTTQGTPAADTNPPNTPFSINLVQGWNLIGDPYRFSVDYLSASIQDANGNSYDILTAQGGTSPLIGGALWAYQNGAYSLAYSLDPWQGYWLRAFQPGLKLVLTPSLQINRSATLKTGTPSAATRAAANFSNSGGQAWVLTLQAQAGTVKSVPGLVGTNRSASDAYDRYKVLTPPAIGNQNVMLTFNHTDWGDKSGQYSVDLRSATNTAPSWDFTVSSNVANTPVVLTWPSLATVSNRRDVILTDLDTNTKIDPRTRASYQIPASTTTVTRHFRITVTRAVRRKLQLTDFSAHLTGTRASGTPVSVGISYTTTADATVQVNILRQGRRIRTLDTGTTRAAGSTGALWDLKTDQGVTVSADTYAVEVIAVDQTGYRVRQVRPLIITR